MQHGRMEGGPLRHRGEDVEGQAQRRHSRNHGTTAPPGIGDEHPVGDDQNEPGQHVRAPGRDGIEFHSGAEGELMIEEEALTFQAKLFEERQSHGDPFEEPELAKG